MSIVNPLVERKVKSPTGNPIFDADPSKLIASCHPAEFKFDISEGDKRDLLTRARTLVVTSPVEGFGIVILEAAALGTPSVVSDGVPEEVVSNAYNGLRYPFGDIASLADRLIEALSADSLHAALAANAISHARNFTRDSLASRLEEMLDVATGVRKRSEAPVA